jgi:hypothetical protein
MKKYINKWQMARVSFLTVSKEVAINKKEKVRISSLLQNFNQRL